MNLLLVLPILLPLATAALCLIFRSHQVIQRSLATIGAVGLLVVALLLLNTVAKQGMLVTQIGNWPAPYGITIVCDIFSAIMVVLATLMGVAVVIYSLGIMDAPRENHGYYAFLHLLLMGVCGVFLTGDLFNLYVWFEVMLMASFILLALGGEKPQLEGGIKYVTLNLLSSAFFLTALGMLYGTVGTLNMADLARQLPTLENQGLVTTLAILFMIAFGIKSAVFPFFFWLPASYHTPPVPVSAIFAGLLTKVGVYTIIRTFSLLFTHDTSYTHFLLLTIAGFTMVTGVLGAMAQNEFRRILSFHIISQVGYMIMGIGLFTPLAVAGAIFYIMHHIIVKTNLFLASGVARILGGSFELDQLSGLYKSAPGLTILFFISAFSLAGVPPLSGFWAKFILIRASIDVQAYIISATALAVSLLTLYSMTKIWGNAFWGEVTRSPTPIECVLMPMPSISCRIALYLPMVLLASLTLIIGLWAEPIFELAGRAAEQLLHPDIYIQAVLGKPS
jgi:multicomponent Na+:H+ antiporter subunit D